MDKDDVYGLNTSVHYLSKVQRKDIHKKTFLRYGSMALPITRPATSPTTPVLALFHKDQLAQSKYKLITTYSHIAQSCQSNFSDGWLRSSDVNILVIFTPAFFTWIIYSSQRGRAFGNIRQSFYEPTDARLKLKCVSNTLCYTVKALTRVCTENTAWGGMLRDKYSTRQSWVLHFQYTMS